MFHVAIMKEECSVIENIQLFYLQIPWVPLRPEVAPAMCERPDWHHIRVQSPPNMNSFIVPPFV